MQSETSPESYVLGECSLSPSTRPEIDYSYQCSDKWIPGCDTLRFWRWDTILLSPIKSENRGCDVEAIRAEEEQEEATYVREEKSVLWEGIAEEKRLQTKRESNTKLERNCIISWGDAGSRARRFGSRIDRVFDTPWKLGLVYKSCGFLDRARLLWFLWGSNWDLDDGGQYVESRRTENMILLLYISDYITFRTLFHLAIVKVWMSIPRPRATGYCHCSLEESSD